MERSVLEAVFIRFECKWEKRLGIVVASERARNIESVKCNIEIAVEAAVRTRKKAGHQTFHGAAVLYGAKLPHCTGVW